jgi:hypothetical protein
LLLTNTINKTNEIITKYESKKYLFTHDMGGYVNGFIPNKLLKVLNCSPMNETFFFYWWRVVSTVYIMRPNNYTLQWLKENDQLLLKNYSTDNNNKNNDNNNNNNINIINNNYNKNNLIGIYVRRGDKGVEMKLVPLLDYLNAFETIIYNNNNYEKNRKIVNTNININENTLNNNKKNGIFFGTEDSVLLNDAIAWSKNKKVDIFYTNLFDRSGL